MRVFDEAAADDDDVAVDEPVPVTHPSVGSSGARSRRLMLAAS